MAGPLSILNYVHVLCVLPLQWSYCGLPCLSLHCLLPPVSSISLQHSYNQLISTIQHNCCTASHSSDTSEKLASLAIVLVECTCTVQLTGNLMLARSLLHTRVASNCTAPGPHNTQRTSRYSSETLASAFLCARECYTVHSKVLGPVLMCTRQVSGERGLS